MESAIPDPSSPSRLSSPCSNRRRQRTSNDSNSPEFEFCMLRNPSFPQPNLHSADELFSHGVLLPLHLLNRNTHVPQGPDPPHLDHPEPSTSDPIVTNTEPGPDSSLAAVTASTGSKRWKDIFRKSVAGAEGKDKEKERKREKKNQLGANSAAELNIYLWPFSRSRSAGNGGSRPRTASGAGGRKVSSAPCSRSNSAGESKTRKWPNSPSRAGVHLGRTSPVWQVRRTSSGKKNPIPEPTTRNAEKPAGKKETPEPRRSKVTADGVGGKARVLNLNVPMCIGYRNHVSCSSNGNSATSVSIGYGYDSAGGRSGVGNGGGGGLFSIRNLFTKKVY